MVTNGETKREAQTMETLIAYLPKMANALEKIATYLEKKHKEKETCGSRTTSSTESTSRAQG